MEQSFDRIATALLGSRRETTQNQPSGFNRDYVREQQEREAQEREQRQQRERERQEQESQQQQEREQWANIHTDFRDNPNLRANWTEQNFTINQVRDWINIGLRPTDAEFTAYLRDIRQQAPEQVLNFGDINQLRSEFTQWQNTPPQPEQPEPSRGRSPSPHPSEQREHSPAWQNAQQEQQHPHDTSARQGATPSTETSFNNSALNDAINKMNNIFSEDSKEQGHNLPYTPSPGLGMPLNSIMKEDAQKLPWLCMGFNLSQDKNKEWFEVVDWYPFWEVYDRKAFGTFRSWEGDTLTLLLNLCEVEYNNNFSNVLHNFFKCLGDDDKKGWDKLIKDEETEKEQLLITGKREDDKLANKYGWDGWPWRKDKNINIGVPGVKQTASAFTRHFRNQENAYDLDNENHLIGKLRKRGIIGEFTSGRKGAQWGNAPKRNILWITNQTKCSHKIGMDADDIETINQNNGFSHYLIFTDLSIETINTEFINNQTPALNAKSLSELISKITIRQKKSVATICIGPDVLNLKEGLTPQQKDKAKDETLQSRENNQKEVFDQDLQEMGLTREEFNLLTAPCVDKAHIANIIKKLANSDNTDKVAEMLNRMFEHLQPATAEAMFNQMVDNNPVFSEQEKEKIKEIWKAAKTTEQKEKIWKSLTSHAAQHKTHAKKTAEQKQKIFEEQVNNNPRYGPPNVDTQERRDRFREYQQATPEQQENMQQEENERFTTGQNAHQWGDYFTDNSNREAGAGDETVGTENDNNFNGQFSFLDSMKSINKLKDIINMKPDGMQEGMISNKPYWKVIMNHPLTYIFCFIGIVIAIMASVTRKNK